MDLQTCKERLEANRFTVKVFETKAEAADYLDQSIDGKTVGMGGSMSLAELTGLRAALQAQHGLFPPERR